MMDLTVNKDNGSKSTIKNVLYFCALTEDDLKNQLNDRNDLIDETGSDEDGNTKKVFYDKLTKKEQEDLITEVLSIAENGGYDLFEYNDFTDVLDRSLVSLNLI